MAQSRRLARLRRDTATLMIGQARPDGDASGEQPSTRVPRQRTEADERAAAVLEAELEYAEALALVARERDRVARDLHEIIMARLLRLGFELSALEERVEGPVAARIREVVAEVDDMWGDTRRLAFDLLSSHELEVGLVERLQVIVEDAAARVGCEPVLHVSGPVEALPEGITHQLRAVAKEAVLNVVLHAQASCFSVELEVGDDTAELRVLDDGIGMLEHRVGGLGLRNLAARAADLDGAFGFTHADGGGTVVRWSVPVPAPA